MSTDKTFGETLRESRMAKGYSLRRFAAMAGVSPTYQCLIERGDSKPPTASRVHDMALLLGEDPDDWIRLAGRLPEDLSVGCTNLSEQVARLKAERDAAATAARAAYQHLDTYGTPHGDNAREMESQRRVFDLLRPYTAAEPSQDNEPHGAVEQRFTEPWTAITETRPKFRLLDRVIGTGGVLLKGEWRIASIRRRLRHDAHPLMRREERALFDEGWSYWLWEFRRDGTWCEFDWYGEEDIAVEGHRREQSGLSDGAHPADSILVDRLAFDKAVAEIRRLFRKDSGWVDVGFESEPTDDRWNSAFAAYLQAAILRILDDPIHYGFGKVEDFTDHLRTEASR